jgi:hypothetical protein
MEGWRDQASLPPLRPDEVTLLGRLFALADAGVNGRMTKGGVLGF